MDRTDDANTGTPRSATFRRIQEDADTRKERLRRRMIAARTVAGLDQAALVAKIKELGYTRGWGKTTISSMESGGRTIQPEEIPVLARACGVDELFFYLDFAQLEEPDVREAVAQLEDRVSGGFAQIANEMARLEQSLQEHREVGHREEPPAGDPSR
ncbi:MAG TPA: helix-turn-helix transcriptional regulator [Candidatus Saccharimonadales bacterium]|jgi:hypothetical protein|nr:helix-turn-helix transcriptional regulator [Candidatus Saccharimonadales bacterium]